MSKVALTDRVRRIGDDDIEGVVVLLHEFKAIAHMKGEFGTEKPFRHPGKKPLRNVNDVLRRR